MDALEVAVPIKNLFKILYITPIREELTFMAFNYGLIEYISIKKMETIWLPLVVEV